MIECEDNVTKSIVGKLDDLINTYDLIYAGRINSDDCTPPAGSP